MFSHNPRGAAPASHGYSLYVLCLLWASNIINYMDRMALSALLPSIKQDLTLSDTELGLLTGFAFSVCYAICGIPIARLADRGIRRTVIATALAAWSVMTALCGLAQSFGQLFLARIGVGVGEAGCIPPAQSLLCDYFPPHRRPGALAFHSSGIFVGLMISMALAGWLGTVVGWRWTFALLALPGIMLSIILWLTLAEPEQGRLDPPGRRSAAPGFLLVLRRLRGNPTYLLMIAFFVLNGFAQYGFNQWLASFYDRVYGLNVERVGLPLGLAIGLGSAAGLVGGGMLADRLAHKGIRVPLIAGAIATLFAVPVALLALFASSSASSLVMVAILYMLWSVSNGPVMATLYNITEPGMRTTGGAIPIFFGSILGFGFGPLVVGLLSDVFAARFEAEALRYALIAPIAALPIITVVLFAAAALQSPDLPASDQWSNA